MGTSQVVAAARLRAPLRGLPSRKAPHRTAAALGVIACVLVPPTLAQKPVQVEPEIIVTATRVAQPLSAAMAAVSVITASDIAAAGQQSLLELLQVHGGVEIASNGGLGQPSAVFIRGANSAHTLVLVDGVRLASATTGTTAFENIPLNQIERIEIVRGPLSSLYGSDAIGGVIQIFTKSGRYSPGASVSAGYGTYHTRALNASVNGSGKAIDYTLSAGYRASDSIDATKPAIPFGQHNPDRDSYRNVSLSGKIAHRFSRDHVVGATALYSEGRTRFDSGAASDDINRQKLATYSVYSENQLAPAWQSLVRIATGRDVVGLTGSIPATFRTEQDQATWQNAFIIPAGSLLAGAEYLRQKVESTADYTTSARTIRSVFLGYRGDYRDHGVQLNARRDDNSQFGGHSTGSVGYALRVTPGLRLRAAYGTAFHAPTFNDLYFPDFGNPDLKPERSRNSEVGIEYEVHGQRFGATLFESRIADLIVFDLATFLPQNIDRAKIRGAELSYQGEIRGTQLRSKLNWQDPENAVTRAQLPRRAKVFGSVAATRSVAAWRFSAEVLGSGERFDSNNENPRSRLPGYALLNLFVTRTIAPDWHVELRWNNVTDKHYELVQFYNTPGSNVFVNIKWTPTP